MKARMIGYWFWQHALTHASTAGIAQAARNLRKRGVPLDLALVMLRPVLTRVPS